MGTAACIRRGREREGATRLPWRWHGRIDNFPRGTASRPPTRRLLNAALKGPPGEDRLATPRPAAQVYSLAQPHPPDLVTLRLTGLDISENELTGACDHGCHDYGDVHLEQTAIVGNSITAGALPCRGLQCFRDSTAVQADNLIIAQNTCEGGCGDGPVSLTSGATARFRYTVLSGNLFTEARAGAFYLGDGTSLTVESCSIDSNEAPLAGAGAIYTQDYAATPPTASIHHSNWFQNGPDAEYAFHLVDGDYLDSDIDGWEGNQTADPGYVHHSGDAADWDLHLASGSPLIDAGDPAESDADGSRADVGAYGGPGGEWE